MAYLAKWFSWVTHSVVSSNAASDLDVSENCMLGEP